MHIEKDFGKARALLEMAEITLKRLNEFNITKYPSNSLIDYYDIIHKLCEALCFTEGVKFKGEKAHFELINYICNGYGFNLSDEQFLQDLREYRNRISYEGFSVRTDFIKNNSARITKIINTLIKLVKERIK
ncbi:MAG: hypothetical protein AABX28_00785 [Nanoarchaeota archaeon]